MSNTKPIGLNNSHISKEEREARQQAENKLKGDTIISNKAHKELSKNGKKIYKDIISIMPQDFLTGVDEYIVSVVAECLDRMKECQNQINKTGLFDEAGNESKAVKTYEKYSKIFNSYSSKLGMSPKDRASLSCLIINDKANQQDELLNILKD